MARVRGFVVVVVVVVVAWLTGFWGVADECALVLVPAPHGGVDDDVDDGGAISVSSSVGPNLSAVEPRPWSKMNVCL